MTVILNLPVLKYDFDFDMWYDFGEDDDDAAANDDDVIVISGRRAVIWLSSTYYKTVHYVLQTKNFAENVFA